MTQFPLLRNIGIRLLLGLGLGGALFTGLSGCAEENVVVEKKPRPIAWVQVSTSEMSQVRRISGILQAAESAQLSFQVTGKIKSVPARLGDQVKAGDVLAELDESSYELNVKAANAQVHESEAAVREATNEFERQANLYEKGWVSKALYDDAETALESAKSTLEVAQAQLDLANKDLRDAVLRAPYDGTITARNIEPSQQVSAGQSCFEIEGQGGLEISVVAPETIVGQMQYSDVFKASFPAIPDLTLDARITEIGSQAEAANAFPITLFVQDSPAILRAGMSAEVDFTYMGTGRTGYTGPAIRVPMSALVAGEGQTSFAFVYDESTSTVQRRAVQTENIINNEMLISSGLEDGEIIASAGVVYLYDGQEVTLLNRGPRVFN
ncbi:efflux RND transporter periplasmic adaptor subunit [Marinibactrum halimedae]|uniref:Acriflavin resistance protein n=1 Tax=Marinibactrum halimedae TaxID=1444977 RepID=A0AA37WKB6_9GAMM|nr:efflux RND transporter periplasmic adaptor subunit [Marinibactrum halimedae]MCD9459151.1 efflux RND transporter periplasmic adaptor subunit [Marinibactrum halimedae]GLS24753.1 acriflavin resistance protein [Marinibactrum halimedae]